MLQQGVGITTHETNVHNLITTLAIWSVNMLVATEIFQINDIVRLASGHQLIVTKFIPSRPANPYLGILLGGGGTEYKFGHKHHPVKVGVADSNHPALIALKAKNEAKAGPSPSYKSSVRRLCEAVMKGDTITAKAIAATLQHT